MSMKLIQLLLPKNVFYSKIVLKQKCYFLFSKILQFKCYSLQNQTKFNLQNFHNIKQSYPSTKLSTLNNQYNFEQSCNETLESLYEYFEQLIESSPQLDNPDITFSDGVLTIQLGEPYGTYVINRQTPNKQIWLSSPTSGPKRYDFNGTKWIYKHDGVSLHELLTTELSTIFSNDINFCKCVFSGVLNK